MDLVRVVIFDVDGTLYRQAPLRRAMLVRLLRAAASRPIAGWRTIRVLRRYRQAQETMRQEVTGDLAEAQIQAVSAGGGFDPGVVRDCVGHWMEREPLSLLARHIHSGLEDFLAACRARGLRLAVLSDYPATAKLEALGIAHFFDLALCAQDPSIGVFKPDPKGLRVLAEQLDVRADECLYVGDRVEVDAAAAAAAGMRCAIIGRDRPHSGDTHTTVSGYSQLSQLLFGLPGVALRAVSAPESSI